MRFKQIIFDVDDTLIDFAATEDFALHALFKKHHWQLTREMQKRYHAYNQGLWRKLEQGTISYNQLSEQVFQVFLKQNFGLEVDGKAIMAEYRSYFEQAYQLLPGVEDALRFAQNDYQLTVLSNGEAFMQRHRLEQAGVEQYFSLIVTSEEAGFSKPDRRVFDYFFDQTTIGPEDTIFFGDGLQSDILGAENYGFASVWYNHRHRRNDLNLHPMFEVQTYPQFVDLLKRDFQPGYRLG
ncbi:YjjG family noncanonical pyrimidine nucleotidase [Lactobacillus sp. ESL0684]|uniref:YjjG family noncanonical pyrimidine nucleotidase n=1 Tax=Lactobacillus sp. ESL0684 TaxID=2983213 RepID=UPI0023F8B08D|nr:YjjG family noncanonical pyrimidine nucleotidase [Lactobacillus sp. ESL0684]WEV43693.1 YjjG family noncanonical pyrimidine nucleotidase [Lactobacillus sp. ESL0684]